MRSRVSRSRITSGVRSNIRTAANAFSTALRVQIIDWEKLWL